jgi:hypothetical protein
LGLLELLRSSFIATPKTSYTTFTLCAMSNLPKKDYDEVIIMYQTIAFIIKTAYCLEKNLK